MTVCSRCGDGSACGQMQSIVYMAKCPRMLALSDEALDVVMLEGSPNQAEAARMIRVQRSSSYHGPWSHPHTEQAQPFLPDPYKSDHRQRAAAATIYSSWMRPWQR